MTHVTTDFGDFHVGFMLLYFFKSTVKTVFLKSKAKCLADIRKLDQILNTKKCVFYDLRVFW